MKTRPPFLCFVECRAQCSMRQRAHVLPISMAFLEFHARAAPARSVSANFRIHDRILRLSSGAPNVLSLSRHVPPRAGQTDTPIYEARGADAPGQRTARGRLL